MDFTWATHFWQAKLSNFTRDQNIMANNHYPLADEIIDYWQ